MPFALIAFLPPEGSNWRPFGLGLFAAIVIRSIGQFELYPALVLAPFAYLAPTFVVAGLVGLTCLIYSREVFELLLELLIWPLYRIAPTGPGKDRIPISGPCIIIGNHTSWLDPLWLGKFVPRRIIPMMTSKFYDVPVLRFVMVRIVRAIRVPMSRFKRETPELTEAIKVLDSGQCLVVFPEGAMRRVEENPLRHFGRGIWHILRQRPETPVVVCWIEGGWGSFFSYSGGPPTKNKRLDWWRPIQIGVQAPLTVPTSILANQRVARAYLMDRCLDARRLLGLEPVMSLKRDFKDEDDENPDE